MEVVMGGKFYVISGYFRLMYCQYVMSVEVYDFFKWLWLWIENLLNVGLCVVVSVVECFYVVCDQEFFLYCFNDNIWRLLDKLFEGDEGIFVVLCMIFFGLSFVLIGVMYDDEEKCKMFLY